MTTVTELEKVSRVVPKRFRVEDFRRMTEAGILPEDNTWEIIDGYLIDRMSTGKKHTSTVKRLDEILRDILGKTVNISIQDPIHLDDYNEPIPDVAVLKRRNDFYAEYHATPEDILLIIEVSDSSIGYDRNYKKTLYGEAGIIEFWIVNLTDETVECYSQLKNGNYRLARILEKGEMVESSSVEDLKLQVEEILGL